MDKTFKTKVYTDAVSEAYCNRAFGVRRCLWNTVLGYMISEKKRTGKRPNNYTASPVVRKMIKEKKDKNFEWLCDNFVTSTCYDQLLQDIETSFNNIRKATHKNSSHPRFKSRNDRVQTFSYYIGKESIASVVSSHAFSICTPQRGKHVIFHTYESLEFLKKATIKLKRFTIKRQSGELWLCISYEAPEKPKKATAKIGLDLGVIKSVVSYDGESVEIVAFNTKESMHYDQLSKKNDDKLSRMTYGSNRYEKQLLLKQKRAQRAANIRKDRLENYVRFLVDNYGEIVIDDFSFKGAKKVANHDKLYRCMVSQFKLRLEQKATEYGTTVRYADHLKGQKTTKVCCVCGSTNVQVFNNRELVCHNCKTRIDRDENAAKVAFAL